MRTIRSVYVAGPLTSGDLSIEDNAFMAVGHASSLLDLGLYVFVPHTMTLPLHEYQPRSYTHWMELCFYWLLRCDAVLRLPGESKGADCEVALAKLHNIPVFASIDELKMHLQQSANGGRKTTR